MFNLIFCRQVSKTKKNITDLIKYLNDIEYLYHLNKLLILLNKASSYRHNL